MSRGWQSYTGFLLVSVVAGCIGVAPENGPATAPARDGTDVIGSTLESFSFPSPDGKMITWEPQSGLLSTGDEQVRLAALVLHAFQPDCNSCQTQAKALEALRRESSDPRVAVAAIAHRGTESDVSGFVGEFGISFPMAVATGSKWAEEWGRGDPLYITDGAGRIVYAQAGFQETDAPIWRVVLDDVVAGRPPSFQRPQRAGEQLSIGDHLPSIELPDLMTGRPMALVPDSRGVHFTGVDGRERACRVTVGFFSRY